VQDPETHTFHLKDLKVEHFDQWSENRYELQFRQTAVKLEDAAIRYTQKKRKKVFSVQMPKVLAIGSSQNRNFWNKILS